MTEQEYLNKLTKNEDFFREEFSDVFEAIERYKNGEIDDVPYSYWNTKSNYRFNIGSKEILAENEGKWGDAEIVMLCCNFNEGDKSMVSEDNRLYNAYITYWEEDSFWSANSKYREHNYNIGSESIAPVPDWFVKYLCDADEIHRTNIKTNDKMQTFSKDKTAINKDKGVSKE